MLLPENRLSESYHIVLARRMATWLSLIYILLFMGILIGFGVSWLNSKSSIIPADFPLTLIEACFLLGILGVALPSLFSLVFQPQIFDWTLDIYDTTDSTENDERLEILQRFADIQHQDRAILRRRVKLYLSDELSMNALTYGGFLKAPRIVFAADIFEQFSDNELQGILCHELGHVHYGDFYVNIAFHYLLRIFDIIFFPIRYINKFLNILIIFSYMIPIAGVILRAVVYLLKIAFAGFILPIWLVKSLHSLQGQLREYIADDYAVRLMSNADSILSSLMKLEDCQMKIFDAPEEFEDNNTQEGENQSKEIILDDDSADRDASKNIEFSDHEMSEPPKKKSAPKSAKSPIKGRYRRYATVIYEVELGEPDTTIQRIYAFIKRINDTHPPSAYRWKRIARIGFQIGSGNEQGVV